MTIYESITPTYLYIKQHTITKKKYFEKTTQDPYKYSGSGPRWIRHFKKHGKQHIKTLWVSDLYYDTSIVEIALHFSQENNIVKSNDWANQKPENGLDGALFGSKHTDKTKNKMKTSHSNRTEEERLITKQKLINTLDNRTPEEIENTTFNLKSSSYKNKSEQDQEIISNKLKDIIAKRTSEEKEEIIFKRNNTLQNKSPEDKIKSKIKKSNAAKTRHKTMTSEEKEITFKNISSGLLQYYINASSEELIDRYKTVSETCNSRSIEEKAIVSENIRKGMANSPIRQCLYCIKSGKGSNMTTYHFDNCKQKPKV